VSTTLVSVALGGLLAAALLGPAFDRRSVAVVCAAAALPDLDALAGLLAPGLANALLHTLLLPALAGALLWYDLRGRPSSWLRDRSGARGVRIAWVALLSLALAGIGLDLLNVEGVAPLFPLSNARYGVVGSLAFSTTEGIVQTYLTVNLDGGPLVAVGMARPPRPVYDPATGRVALPLVEGGWQLVVALAGAATLAGRGWLARRRAGTPGEAPDAGDGPVPEDAPDGPAAPAARVEEDP
jgi:hypothetical protein